MEKILVVLEKTDNNYAAFIPILDGCVATGTTVQEVKESLNEAVTFHLFGMTEEGLEIPDAIKGEYTFSYKMDVESFFEWFQGVITKAGISKLTGMNQSLVSQYANGLKKPSKKQTNRIQTALHEFGEELLQIHF
ncbi:MAG: type II toxin-antitoxin system HicB family antitoxin [Bacteroidales bacterium]|nr:type II toxin-antitoxin system HicB family antitoxin [Bacteroidales bacterium]